MADTTTIPPTGSKPKSKPAAAPILEAPKVELPKFEFPKFEVPNLEVPAVFREFAEKGIAQARENYEKCRSAAEQTTDMLEDTYSTATKGACDYGLKLIETARANSNAAFDLYGDLLGAKSYAEAVERTGSYLRAQFEATTAQARELGEHAQKVAAETAEPLKGGFANAFGKAA